MKPAAKIRGVAAFAVLVGVASGIGTGWGHAPWWAPVLLTGAVIVAEIALVHLSFGRQRYSFSLTEGAIAAALVSDQGAWIIASVVVGVLAAQLIRHQERLKV